MKERRKIPLPLLVLPVWLLVRVLVAHFEGRDAGMSALHAPIEERDGSVANASRGAPLAADVTLCPVPAREMKGDVVLPGQNDEHCEGDPGSDFGQRLASLAADQLQSADAAEVAELPALPLSLDWESLSEHGLMIPPADRPVATECANVEPPLPSMSARGGESNLPGPDPEVASEPASRCQADEEQAVSKETSDSSVLANGGSESAPERFDAPCQLPASCNEASSVAGSVIAPSDADVDHVAASNRAETSVPVCSDECHENEVPMGEAKSASPVECGSATLESAALACEPDQTRFANGGAAVAATDRGVEPNLGRPVAGSAQFSDRRASLPAQAVPIAEGAKGNVRSPASTSAPMPSAGLRGQNNAVQLASASPAQIMPPRSLPRSDMTELEAVSRLADAHTKRGFDLAGHNALYSARAEFIHALGMVSQALDAIDHTTAHVQAMNDGLQALEESSDFVAESSRLTTNFDVLVVARPHTTPLLKNRAGGVSSMQALQEYYTYAQERFAFAAGHQPAGSLALHGLGKVYVALAKTKCRQAIAAEPKAIVFFQAALLADPRNFMAANELGVLLANYGKYEQAKAAFMQSLRVSGQPVAWRNLAVVHSQLGEGQLAMLAMQEADLAARKGFDRRPGPLGLSTKSFDIQWVDPATFARIGESPGIQAPASPTAGPVAPVTAQQGGNRRR